MQIRISLELSTGYTHCILTYLFPRTCRAHLLVMCSYFLVLSSFRSVYFSIYTPIPLPSVRVPSRHHLLKPSGSKDYAVFTNETLIPESVPQSRVQKFHWQRPITCPMKLRIWSVTQGHF
jgi:hypothetical protein